MADADNANFGNADGGGTVDGGNDGRDFDRAQLNGEPGSPTNPAAFGKRGRGRPRKDGSTGTGGAGTGEAGSAGQSASKSQSKSGAKLDVDLFASQIVGAHQMLALVTKNPIWVIQLPEAKNLATALRDVMAFHSININPMYIAYGKLLAICAAIYGPKLLMLSMMAKQRRDSEKDITPGADNAAA